MKSDKSGFEAAKILSPKRKTTEAGTIKELAMEQLKHFNIDPKSSHGKALKGLVENIYQSQGDLNRLWEETLSCL